jgi:hypothetical protein
MDYRENAAPLERDRSILVVGLNGRLFGLDRASGEPRWFNDLEGSSGEVTLAIDYGVVIASAAHAALYCIDYLTGVTRWRQFTKDSGRATILLEPDQIVCMKSGYVDCFAPDGRLLWQQPLKGQGLGRGALGYPGNVAQADDPGTE